MESEEGRKETCDVGFAAAGGCAGEIQRRCCSLPWERELVGEVTCSRSGGPPGSLAPSPLLPEPAGAGVSSSSPQARCSQGCRLRGAARGHQRCPAACQAAVASRSIRGSASLVPSQWHAHPSRRAAGGRARASRGHPPGPRPPPRSEQGPAPWGRPMGLAQAEEWGLQQVLSASTSKETRGCPRLFWRLISAPHRGVQEGRGHVPAASAVPTGQD